jgi:hypothetical protein
MIVVNNVVIIVMAIMTVDAICLDEITCLLAQPDEICLGFFSNMMVTTFKRG